MMIRHCLPALYILATAPAIAQEAPAKPSATLTSVGYGSSFGLFVEKPPADPGDQVEIWVWNILKEPKQLANGSYDMTASREVIDCAARTVKQLYADGFLGDAYLSRSPGDGSVRQVQDGTSRAAYVNIACGKVDLSKDAPIADLAAARALVAAHFAQKQ